MIQLIGIKGECSIEIRQKFSIVSSQLQEKLKKLNKIIGSVVILSTCNRTEIYVDSELQDNELINIIFDVLEWDKNLSPYIFYVKNINSIKHLMEVSCGFHSKILGEDQILGQIKDAYGIALKLRTVKGALHRLFENAIACGKEFKNNCEIYKIPVSSPSITVQEALSKGAKRYMVIGFGEIGKLVFKYLRPTKPSIIYVAVRNLSKIDDVYKNQSGVKFINFSDRQNYYNDLDCIISCTYSSYTIISKKDIPLKKLLIFDLAIPRDVDRDVSDVNGVEVYDIDDISSIDEENKIKRKEKMEKYRYIIQKYMKEFLKWQRFNELSPEIQKIKRYGNKICEKRIDTFKNKKYTKDNEQLASIMIQSTAKVYISRAIKLLKEEKINGRENECIRFINSIFCDEVNEN